ncbi:hypothetical protein Kpol_1032p59 [Vanderwaltozyma polyspora DSM 70294]|uniref:arginyltransferase n=1 Tax=Vanderwaltozyma polyspora (strain ATCC 22028 / DSM 70294 / BCRC 21397 / CBS 2163 / NBRC 10782 / NRRL Y-8283 / UCD 57-17) TaxID=436907 RepID=A7TH13_VANPO|nr:uncharacterized protein Kpol_1032p59 [Vanderwaltozyma polyspora DSM 70294]EDO18465.1 hypothetical protein Kpol_1032p59 [Vanderwaltozyma polyspora DSM 70294]
MDLTDKLIISRPLYFTDDTSNCGYCSGKKADKRRYFALDSWYEKYSNDLDQIKVSNNTVGFHLESISIDKYDNFCNMGFRRSGTFIYKCDMLRNCCRLYTIRTSVGELTLTKELKKALTRFRKLICSDNLKPNDSQNFIEEIANMEKSSNRFKTVFEPPVFTEEKYQLFAKFQEEIHNDFDHTPKSFKRFLCNSPFPEKTIMGDKEEWCTLNHWRDLKSDEYITRLGPTHECYYLDDKLIAFAVTDFMKTGISSVYFVWDPTFAKYSLGKVSALRELAITSKIKDGFYYLGYYISDCDKMNYKGKYGGELLDICSGDYVPLSKVSKIIETGNFFMAKNPNEQTNPDEEPLMNEVFEKQCHKSLKNDIPLVNISDMIYGVNSKSVMLSNEAVLELNKLGIPYTQENITSIYKLKNETDKPSEEMIMGNDKVTTIPNVIPGLISLPELVDMIKKHRLTELNYQLIIFDSQLGKMRLVSDFDSEIPETKRIICDMIRTVGLEYATDTILIL